MKKTDKKIKNKRILKNGAIAGYVYYANEKKWKWRIIGNSNKKKGGANYDILRFHNNQNIHIPDFDMQLYKLLSNNPLEINFNRRNIEMLNYFNNCYDNLPANFHTRFIRDVILFVQIEPGNIREMNLQEFQNNLNTLHNYDSPSMRSNALLHSLGGVQNNAPVIYIINWEYVENPEFNLPQNNNQRSQENMNDENWRAQMTDENWRDLMEENMHNDPMHNNFNNFNNYHGYGNFYSS
jgi:hypothetical protein